MRKRTIPRSRRGSMWMSEARWSKAYCHSQSTIWTMCWSLASNWPVALAEFDQLLEARQAGGDLAACRRLLDRLGEVEELDQVARDVIGIGEDAADFLAQDRLQFLDPFADERLGGGDDDLARRHLHRQDAEAAGIGARHDIGDAGEIDLERVDVQVVEADLAGQPFGQRLQRQQAHRRARRDPFLVGDDLQRMILDAVHAPLDPQRLGLVLADEAVGDHPLQHFRKGETVLVRGHFVHAGRIYHVIRNAL